MELYFVMFWMELIFGKLLNIVLSGWESFYRLLRDFLNYLYGWVCLDDFECVRDFYRVF